MDPVVRFSPHASQICSLCQVANETHDLISWAAILGEATLGWYLVVIKKLALQASVYEIWDERNNRKFRSESLVPMAVFKIIVTIIKLRLLSLEIGETPASSELLNEWHV